MRCLFSAPFDFLGEIAQEYQTVLPTRFREIWIEDELQTDAELTAWVVNPGQHFVVGEKVLARAPSLRVLVTPSTGENHIDREACARRGVKVLSLLDDRTALNQITASAEFTFLLLLATWRRLDRGLAEVSAGRWRRREPWLRGHELRGQAVGIVGFGRIGQRLARYLRAFEARVLVCDPHAKKRKGLSWVSLEELFRRSDLICLCCSLTPETHGMIHRSLLNQLKSGACLINTSRGEVIVEEDLASILRQRPDLRVGLDVLAGEARGVQGSSPLSSLVQKGQVVLTPHMAGATVESQRAAARIALGLLRRHFNGAGKRVRRS